MKQVIKQLSLLLTISAAIALSVANNSKETPREPNESHLDATHLNVVLELPCSTGRF